MVEILNLPKTHLDIPVILGWLCQSNFIPPGTITKKSVNFFYLFMGRATMQSGLLISLSI